MLASVLEARFDDLLIAWRYHDDLRRGWPSTSQLAESRMRLDRLRGETYRLRRGLYPEPHEVEDALATAYCDSLDETVFLYAPDARGDDQRRRFACPCGQTITAYDTTDHPES